MQHAPKHERAVSMMQSKKSKHFMWTLPSSCVPQLPVAAGASARKPSARASRRHPRCVGLTFEPKGKVVCPQSYHYQSPTEGELTSHASLFSTSAMNSQWMNAAERSFTPDREMASNAAAGDHQEGLQKDIRCHGSRSLRL